MKVLAHGFLNGVSPNAQAELNKYRAFLLIYKFGFSTDKLITKILNKKATGWAASQVKSGWLKRIESVAPHPGPIFTLTSTGLAWIEQHVKHIHRYPEENSAKIHWPSLRHNLFCQAFLVSELKNKKLISYRAERQNSLKIDKPGVKKPDMVFYGDDSTRVAIEVELSSKWDRRLDDFILKIARDLGYQGDKKYDRYVIVSNSEALINQYRKAFEAGRYLRDWYKDDRGHWMCSVEGCIPEEISIRVKFMRFEAP